MACRRRPANELDSDGPVDRSSERIVSEHFIHLGNCHQGWPEETHLVESLCVLHDTSDLATGVLTINPRLGAKKGSKQLKATDVITGNSAAAGIGGAGGSFGVAQAGTGGSPSGAAGASFLGHSGTAGTSGTGVGGGLDLITGGTVVIDNKTVSGNGATTTDNDVHDTFSV
jgi:hypothetical protein